jgi:hypothetical protein
MIYISLLFFHLDVYPVDYLGYFTNIFSTCVLWILLVLLENKETTENNILKMSEVLSSKI